MSATTRRSLQIKEGRDPYQAAYMAGYADGEGCFCVTFNRSSRHRFGWEIRPSFSVSQNTDRAEVLDMFLQTFGDGAIRPDRSDRTLKYETRSVSVLATKVVPFFRQHPLLSSKKDEFERFAEIVLLMHGGGHLTHDGFAKIAELACSLNASGAKRYGRDQIVPVQMNA